MSEEPEVISWGRRFWDRTQNALYIALVVVGVLVGVLDWYIKAFPSTTDTTIVEQAESIKDDMATSQGVEDVAMALRAYQDSLGRLRTHFDTALITPGLNAILDLQDRVRQIERTGVETRIAVEEQKRQGEQNTDALIDQMNEQSNAEERAKEREREQKEEQDRQDRELMQAIAKKLKIETKRF